jgi:hypothetical protein
LKSGKIKPTKKPEKMRALLLSYLLVLINITFPVSGQDYSIVSKTNHNQNHFGWDISGYRNFCCISDPRDSIRSYGNGSVNLYSKNKQEWVFFQNLSKTDPNPYELFGYKTSMFGDFLAVTSVGNDKMGFMAGSVSVYHFDNGWKFIQEIFPNSPGERMYFGESLQLTSDYLFIGAPGTGDQGAVYIYKLNGDVFTFSQKIDSPYPVDFDFGKTVYASENILFIGAPSVNISSLKSGVFVYKLYYGDWRKIQDIPSPDEETGSRFGYSIASAGNVLIIGSPHSTVLHSDNEEYFFSGKAFIYRYTNSWNLEQVLNNPDPGSQDIFGQDVFIKDSIVFITSPRSDNIGNDMGTVYTFRYYDGSWKRDKNLNPEKSLAYFGNNIFVLNNQVLIGYGGDKKDKNYGEVVCYKIEGLIDNSTPNNIHETLTSVNAILIFPNPARDILNIETGNKERNQMKLYNSKGELIIIENFRNRNSIDVSNMEAGTYLITVESKSLSYSEKIIIQR